MKSQGFAGDFLNLYFMNVDIANVGDAAGLQNSVAAGNLYLSLHTAYPGETGVQNTSECAYTSYVRKSVARTAAEWTLATETITNDNSIAFAACTGSSETAYFVGIGRQSAGATELDYICPMGVELGEGTAKTTDTITIPGLSGVSVDDRIAFFVLPKIAIPTGITAGTIYWVKTVSSDDITVSTTQGGGALDITAVGSVLAYKMIGLAISNGITPTISAGQLAIREE